MVKDGRIGGGESGRLAVNGLEGCSQRERGAMACIAGGYAFQVYFWLPVDHNRQQILDALNSFIPYIVRQHVFLTSAGKALPPWSNRRIWVNLGSKDSVE